MIGCQSLHDLKLKWSGIKINYIIWLIIHYNHTQVHMVIADELAPIWCQDVCDCYDDANMSVQICNDSHNGTGANSLTFYQPLQAL